LPRTGCVRVLGNRGSHFRHCPLAQSYLAPYPRDDHVVAAIADQHGAQLRSLCGARVQCQAGHLPRDTLGSTGRAQLAVQGAIHVAAICACHVPNSPASTARSPTRRDRSCGNYHSANVFPALKSRHLLQNRPMTITIDLKQDEAAALLRYLRRIDEAGIEGILGSSAEVRCFEIAWERLCLALTNALGKRLREGEIG